MNVPSPQQLDLSLSTYAEKQGVEEDRGWGKRVGVTQPGISCPRARSGPKIPKPISSLTLPAPLFPASNIDNVVLDEDRSGARRLQNLWR